jgi:AcrB/AcrD/AcrF family
LRNLPILGGNSGQAQIVANVASISRTTTSPIEDHYNIRPVINIYGGVDGKDLGYVSDQIQKLVDTSRKDLPRGSFISVRGQVTTMHDSYTGLYVGLAFSMLLAYLLMVVNFQFWIQPFIIITALPCALTGIIWILFATGTTLSVPALMGAIMCMGVAWKYEELPPLLLAELTELDLFEVGDTELARTHWFWSRRPKLAFHESAVLLVVALCVLLSLALAFVAWSGTSMPERVAEIVILLLELAVGIYLTVQRIRFVPLATRI